MNVHVLIEHHQQAFVRSLYAAATSFNDLQQLNIAVLRGKLTSCPGSVGIFPETYYMADNLIEAVKTGLLTCDSNPGYDAGENLGPFAKYGYGRDSHGYVTVILPKVFIKTFIAAAPDNVLVCTDGDVFHRGVQLHMDDPDQPLNVTTEGKGGPYIFKDDSAYVIHPELDSYTSYVNHELMSMLMDNFDVVKIVHDDCGYHGIDKILLQMMEKVRGAIKHLPEKITGTFTLNEKPRELSCRVLNMFTQLGLESDE